LFILPFPNLPVRVLTAEDVRVQKLIAEFALRIALLTQFNKFGQLPVDGP